jgi:hypothetical protein
MFGGCVAASRGTRQHRPVGRNARRRSIEEAVVSERDPEIPDTVEGEPVADVEPATEPLTPEEIREAQERDEGGSQGEPGTSR